ncbi:hypothetical protein ACFFUY_18865, partial [Vibrio lentus]
VKVARTVLRGAALGNKCRLLDRGVLAGGGNTKMPQSEPERDELRFKLRNLSYFSSCLKF